MFALTNGLAAIGGPNSDHAVALIGLSPGALRNFHGAIAILLVTVMHPIMAFGIVLVTSVVSSELGPGSHFANLPESVQKVLYVILPSTNLLSESNFLSITETSLKRMAWTDHLLALSYGLDYALICFLLAVWSFRYRSLTRD